MGGQISIHALREEGDGSGFSVVEVLCLFLSTPSARRATPYQQYCINRIVISIHALREEGDAALWPARLCWRYFYPRPPRGGRRPSAARRQTDPQFLSTPSARRATSLRSRLSRGSGISIHALREEGDWQRPRTSGFAGQFLSTPSARRATQRRHGQALTCGNFYPRPPRGGRRDLLGGQILTFQFLSTPSARRATRISGSCPVQ